MTVGKFSDYEIANLIEAILSRPSFGSLHTSDPFTDPLATEMGGASYARPQLSWVLLGTRGIQTGAKTTWSGMDAGTARWVGVFDSPFGSRLRWALPIPPVLIIQGGRHDIAPGELYLRWP